MRSGLLAVGVILLVLGAIFYFVPTPASATQDESVTTTTYAGVGNGTNETNSTVYGETTATTDGTGWADRQNVNEEGVPVVYVYLDENGDMYSEDGAYLGEGLTSADMNTRVGDTYGSGTQTTSDTTSDTTYADNSAGATGDMDSRINTADNGQVTGQAGQVVTADTTAETQGMEDGFNDPDTFGDAEDDGLNAGAVNTADENVAGAAGGWLRTLSILAMVLGAILTILGLVLPSRDYVADRARTTSPAGRRVRYEREEEHHHVRK